MLFYYYYYILLFSFLFMLFYFLSLFPLTLTYPHSIPYLSHFLDHLPLIFSSFPKAPISRFVLTLLIIFKATYPSSPTHYTIFIVGCHHRHYRQCDADAITGNQRPSSFPSLSHLTYFPLLLLLFIIYFSQFSFFFLPSIHCQSFSPFHYGLQKKSVNYFFFFVFFFFFLFYISFFVCCFGFNSNCCL